MITSVSQCGDVLCASCNQAVPAGYPIVGVLRASCAVEHRSRLPRPPWIRRPYSRTRPVLGQLQSHPPRHWTEGHLPYCSPCPLDSSSTRPTASLRIKPCNGISCQQPQPSTTQDEANKRAAGHVCVCRGCRAKRVGYSFDCIVSQIDDYSMGVGQTREDRKYFPSAIHPTLDIPLIAQPYKEKKCMASPVRHHLTAAKELHNVLTRTSTRYVCGTMRSSRDQTH